MPNHEGKKKKEKFGEEPPVAQLSHAFSRDDAYYALRDQFTHTSSAVVGVGQAKDKQAMQYTPFRTDILLLRFNASRQNVSLVHVNPLRCEKHAYYGE